MKTMSTVLLILLTFSAHATEYERCFDAGDGKTGQITMTDRSVRVDYDLADRARHTEEYSNILSNFRETSNSVSAEAFMRGTGDGGDVKITIRKNHVSFQALWSNGDAAERPVNLNIVPCP